MSDQPAYPTMPHAADPARLADPFRLAALDATGLTDGAADAVLDRVAGIATALLGVPVALVSLVDPTGQRFPGLAGLGGWAGDARGTPLTHSFCQHVVERRAPLVVADAAVHPLVRDNAAREDLGVAAYVGVPLTSTQGDTLGALCAIDVAPRTWTDEQIDALRGLAACAMAELELRSTTRALALSRSQLAASEARLARVLAETRCAVWEWDLVDGSGTVSPEWGPLFGVAAGEGIASLDAFIALIHPADRLSVRAALDDAVAGRADYDVRYRVPTGAGAARILHDHATVRRDPCGRAVHLAGVVRDLTPPA